MPESGEGPIAADDERFADLFARNRGHLYAYIDHRVDWCVGESEVVIERPSETVTFLFTDVEDSTAVWEASPTAIPVWPIPPVTGYGRDESKRPGPARTRRPRIT